MAREEGEGVRPSANIPFGDFLDHFLFFINTYLMMNNQNMLSIILNKTGERYVLSNINALLI